jgi:hypothetical protein
LPAPGHSLDHQFLMLQCDRFAVGFSADHLAEEDAPRLDGLFANGRLLLLQLDGRLVLG